MTLGELLSLEFIQSRAGAQAFARIKLEYKAKQNFIKLMSPLG